MDPRSYRHCYDRGYPIISSLYQKGPSYAFRRSFNVHSVSWIVCALRAHSVLPGAPHVGLFHGTFGSATPHCPPAFVEFSLVTPSRAHDATEQEYTAKYVFCRIGTSSTPDVVVAAGYYRYWASIQQHFCFCYIAADVLTACFSWSRIFQSPAEDVNVRWLLAARWRAVRGGARDDGGAWCGEASSVRVIGELIQSIVNLFCAPAFSFVWSFCLLCSYLHRSVEPLILHLSPSIVLLRFVARYVRLHSGK